MTNIKFIFTLLIGFALVAVSLANKNPEPLNIPASREELGRLLFFDKVLSSDKTLSCSSCHKPEFAFADTLAFSKGVNGNLTIRNTPTAMNVAYREGYFWDGRVASLEEQALFPIENPIEMNLKIDVALARLNKDEVYVAAFKKIYNAAPDKTNLGDALAAFERTLETSGTPFDLFSKGDSTAISEAAKRGQQVFNFKGKCFDCHFGPDFTGDEFRNIGLFNARELNDAGRYSITKEKSDKGKFKVPGLRNVAVTAPYMHNGMFRTLREVIDYYSEPEKFVKGSINVDPITNKGVHLNEAEKQDLEAFLISLTDTSFRKK